MMSRRTNPTLYQIDVRDWLWRLRTADRPRPTLDDVPDTELARLEAEGFDLLWLLGVWQTGAAGAAISRAHQEWEAGYRHALPDFGEEDVTGSPFAITSYAVAEEFGGDAALARLRERLCARGVGVALDFVPNHTAIDHPWARDHPEFYVPGDTAEGTSVAVETYDGERLLAHGRDPYFAAWPDTLQLNYGSEELQAAMVAELCRVAARCDGVRCDMAMLILPDVFVRTWGIAMKPFWERAIARVRTLQPEFLLLAEVYWHREYDLQQIGFDFTYDKELYDRLRAQDGAAVRGHLQAAAAFQAHSARFLENHDEERAAAVFPGTVHEAAAMIAFFVPGLRLLHDGQLSGLERKPSVHLRRRQVEAGSEGITSFYSFVLRLLREPCFQGEWELLETAEPAVLASAWRGGGGVLTMVVVNYSGEPARPRLPIRTGYRGRQPVEGLEMGQSEWRTVRESVEASMTIELEAWEWRVLRVTPL